MMLNEIEKSPQVFHPWRRYLARTMDFIIYNLLWSAFIAFIFHVNVAVRSGLENLLDSFMAFVIMLVLEPLWLHLFRTTPGKAIFGLRIENHGGSRLSYGEGLERTWSVIGDGSGIQHSNLWTNPPLGKATICVVRMKLCHGMNQYPTPSRTRNGIEACFMYVHLYAHSLFYLR